MRSPRFDEVGEAEGEIAERYDRVGSDDWVRRLLKNGEQELEVRLAELRTAPNKERETRYKIPHLYITLVKLSHSKCTNRFLWSQSVQHGVNKDTARLWYLRIKDNVPPYKHSLQCIFNWLQKSANTHFIKSISFLYISIVTSPQSYLSIQHLPHNHVLGQGECRGGTKIGIGELRLVVADGHDERLEDGE